VLETFVAVAAIIVLVIVLGFVWRRMGRSLNTFYIFIIYCTVDMIILLSMSIAMGRPLSVWKFVVGFFLPPPFSLIFLI